MERGNLWRQATDISAQRQRDRASYTVALFIVSALGGLFTLWLPDGFGFLDGFAITALAFGTLCVVGAAVGRSDR